MFGRRKDEYQEAKKNLNDNSKLKASKRIVFEMLEDNDEAAAQLVDKMKNGQPLVINFSQLDKLALNKMLAFFCGASYAIEGESLFLKDHVYLFARKVDFLDGSLKEFLETYREQRK